MEGSYLSRANDIVSNITLYNQGVKGPSPYVLFKARRTLKATCVNAGGLMSVIPVDEKWHEVTFIHDLMDDEDGNEYIQNTLLVDGEKQTPWKHPRFLSGPDTMRYFLELLENDATATSRRTI